MDVRERTNGFAETSVSTQHSDPKGNLAETQSERIKWEPVGKVERQTNISFVGSLAFNVGTAFRPRLSIAWEE